MTLVGDGDWWEQLDAGTEEETFLAMYRVAASMAGDGEQWPTVQDAYLQAWGFRPTRAEPLYAIARHHRIAGNYQLGYDFAVRAVAIPLPEHDTGIDAPDV